MKKRNPFVVLLLSLVTLGIYIFFWLYFTRKELLGHTEDKKAIWPVSYLFAPLAFILIAILLYIGFTTDSPPPPVIQIVSFLLGAVSVIAMIVIPIMWLYKYCKVVGAVTKGMDGITLFAIGIILSFLSVGFVWPLIVQLELNKFIEAGEKSAAPTPPETPDKPAA